MASTESSAPPAHHVPEAVRERVLRGLVLHADHVEEIEHEGHGVYSVPGCSGGTYRVDLAPFGGVESCSCPDYRRHKTPCKHVYATTISRSKSRAASRRDKAPKLAPDAIAANLDRLGA